MKNFKFTQAVYFVWILFFVILHALIFFMFGFNIISECQKIFSYWPHNFPDWFFFFFFFCTIIYLFNLILFIYYYYFYYYYFFLLYTISWSILYANKGSVTFLFLCVFVLFKFKFLWYPLYIYTYIYIFYLFIYFLLLFMILIHEFGLRLWYPDRNYFYYFFRVLNILIIFLGPVCGWCPYFSFTDLI